MIYAGPLVHQLLAPERFPNHLGAIVKGRAAAGIALLMLTTLPSAGMADAPDTRISQGLKSTYQVYIQEQKAGSLTGNNSIIYQQGSGNIALINQQHQRSGRANLAIIDQNGSDNQGTIVQRGSDNIGVLEQQGSGLSHEMYQGDQGGSQFEALVQQSGFNASVQLSQSGSGLRALRVRQWAPSGAGTRVTVDTR